MWNFETLWQAIATSPFLWGAAALALISLAMLWRIIAHANFVRRWEVKQQLLQSSPRSAELEPSRSASARASLHDSPNSLIAQEAALIVSSGHMDVLQLQTYEDIQNPEDVQELLFDIEINLSNLAQLSLQILEVSVYADTLEQPILLNTPVLLRADSSQQLSQRFRYQELNFNTCNIFYMRIHQEQPQLYRLRCPLQWSEAQQCYNLQVGAQQIQAAISLESQSRYNTEPSLLDTFLNKAPLELASKETIDKALADNLAEDGTAQYNDKVSMAPSNNVINVEDTIDESLGEAIRINHLLLDDEEARLLEDSIAEGEETTAKHASMSNTSMSNTSMSNTSMSKVLERWFAEDPNLKELPQDSFNTDKTKSESYKKSWSPNEKKSVPKGSKFPEHF